MPCIAIAKASSTTLNESGGSRQPLCLILEDTLSTFSHIVCSCLHIQLYRAACSFYYVRLYSSISSFLKAFIRKTYWILSKAFFSHCLLKWWEKTKRKICSFIIPCIFEHSHSASYFLFLNPYLPLVLWISNSCFKVFFCYIQILVYL